MHTCAYPTVLGSVLLALALNAGDAVAATPKCGQTIARDTRLSADLRNCPGHGIVIGADNVTLDLNGHTIDGNGVASECPEDSVCDSGVKIADGRRRVRVLNGTIRDFVLGVHGNGLAQAQVRGLSLTHNEVAGIILQGGQIDSEVTDNRVSGSTVVGIDLVDARRATVARNVVTGATDFFALYLYGASDSTVEENTASDSDAGIGLGGASDHNVIRRNVVTHSQSVAIEVQGAANRIEDNRVEDNVDGIFTEIDESTHDNVIRGNLVTGTGTFGGPDTLGIGIAAASDRTLVERNIVTGGRGPGIVVGVIDDSTTAEDVIIARNLVNSRFDDAILITHGSSGTVVRENTAFGSGDDGIEVTVPSATLIANTAVRNHDYGIEAVAGVTDGGRNHAFANGNPLQCLNIAC